MHVCETETEEDEEEEEVEVGLSVYPRRALKGNPFRFGKSRSIFLLCWVFWQVNVMLHQCSPTSNLRFMADTSFGEGVGVNEFNAAN